VLLVGFVLTNSYRGVVNSDLATPVSTSRIATVMETLDKSYLILMPSAALNSGKKLQHIAHTKPRGPERMYEYIGELLS